MMLFFMSLEDLIRYESAAVAVAKEKERPDISLQAISNFYNQLIGEDDPIIASALNDAQRGLQLGAQTGNPIITNTGVKSAIIIYGGKYEKVFANTKVFNLVTYLGDSYNIPETVEQRILEYQDSLYKDLIEKAKENEVAKKVVSALALLKNYKLERKYVDIYKENIDESLKEMFP